MITSLEACKTLCELSNWRISNLRSQKVLYFAHMYLLGEVGEPLIRESFEAWDYGPVEPNLYRHVKIFGKESIEKPVFYGMKGAEPNTHEYDMLEILYKATRDVHPGDLINMTHWEKGAWYEYYEPGSNIRIPNERILVEYHDRERLRGEKQKDKN
ncbi:MAG: DUF4065 domain-containing protein [Hyphomicrobiales bacterium]|nr:DUF4065 domain-containing protein [Hyphomicrobiales bacterium]